MHKNNTRPSAALFGETPAAAEQPSQTQISVSSDFVKLQHTLRVMRSVSLLELERVKDYIEQSSLTYTELLALQRAASCRSAECTRIEGWHSGFGDIVTYIQSRLARARAA